MNLEIYTAMLLIAAALCCVDPRASGRVQLKQKSRPAARIVITSAVVAGMVVFYLFGRLSAALAAIAISSCIVWTIKSSLRSRQNKRAQEAMAAFLGVVTADLRAGATVPRALNRGVEALPGNAPTEFAQILHSAAVLAHNGASPHVALQEATHPELLRLAYMVGLAHTHGIALAPLLEQAHNRIDAQRRHVQATAASLQGPQATSIVLACLPLAGIAMGGAMGANSLSFLLGGGLGGALLVGGVVLLCSGFMWSRTIIDKASPC